MAAYGASPMDGITGDKRRGNLIPGKSAFNPLISQVMQNQPGGAPGGIPTPHPGSGFGGPAFDVKTGTTNPSGDGPVTMNPGNYMAMPGNTSAKNLQTVLANTFNNKAGVQGALLNENEKKLDLDNLQNTDLYKSNLEATRSGIGSAYDQAMANAKRSAISSGFGYAQPLVQGAETGIRGEAASAFGKAPATALRETVAPTLEAAQIRSGEMSQFNPDTTMGIWEDLVKGKSAATSQMLSSLMNAAATVGSAGLSKGKP